MPIDVLMPQLGESIAEGTIVRWFKQVGDPVGRDEPLFEISTDKVDAEIPSPAAGVLSQIRADSGATVPVNSVVAQIDGMEPAAAIPQSVETDPPGPDPTDDWERSATPAPPIGSPARGTRRLSPVVRRLAAEHGVDPAVVAGTGGGGRVTKADILAHVAGQGSAGGTVAAAGPTGTEALATRVEPMSVMRRQIAEHMVASRRTAAHVHTVFDVDFSHVTGLRAAYAGAERAPGYLAYVARAVCHALLAMPVINASLRSDDVLYHDHVNLGVAVALDRGLIVPVIKGAHRLSVEQLDSAVTGLATRARAKQLVPDEVKGGTFTITNPGSFGSVLGLPIINQPQTAILCLGAVEQRPVVVDGAVVARWRAYLTLGFDHRLIDGAVADRFLATVRDTIEHYPGAAGAV